MPNPSVIERECDMSDPLADAMLRIADLEGAIRKHRDGFRSGINDDRLYTVLPELYVLRDGKMVQLDDLQKKDDAAREKAHRERRLYALALKVRNLRKEAKAYKRNRDWMIAQAISDSAGGKNVHIYPTKQELQVPVSKARNLAQRVYLLQARIDDLLNLNSCLSKLNETLCKMVPGVNAHSLQGMEEVRHSE